jgi:3',5'-cyclic AMP phosphodiesterase CpdA
LVGRGLIADIWTAASSVPFQTVFCEGQDVHYAWLTDIHLEFLRDRKAARFIAGLATKDIDGLFLTGDISTASKLEFHLRLFEDIFKGPVYFVLGNHDYYGGAIETVRKATEAFCRRSDRLYWLPAAGVFELSRDTCLVGHDGWADGRFGNYEKSRIMLNDYLKIHNFVQVGGVGRLALLNRLGDQAAEYFQNILPEALAKYNHVFVLTHVPPSKEACCHNGALSDDNWLPHFACQAVGDVLVKFMAAHPNRKMTVLCGHTHSSCQAEILPNLQVKTGGAEYGSPAIQEIFEQRK